MSDESKKNKRVQILGYPIDNLTITEHVERIVNWLGSGKRHYFFCANPHSIVEAEKDGVFKKALMSADMVTPDGAGVLLAALAQGEKLKERVTGSDVFFSLNQSLNSSSKKHSCFFLGASNDTLAKIKNKFSVDYPHIELLGVYSPPFKDSFSEAESKIMVDTVNKFKPDILWVGMTAPKQEKWIFENIGRLDVKFVGAIGAVFDFYVGNIKRSNPLFRRLGLEWLPRLLREPRRLWRRNFISSPVFVFKILISRVTSR